MRYFTKYDQVIAFIIIAASVLSYMAFSFFAFSEAPEKVEIYLDGKLYGEYRLEEITTERIVKISSKYGKNVLKITSDGAQVTEASCPDKKDVKDGKITKAGQVIICVPNRVLVKLVAGKTDNIDKVTY